MRKALAGFLVCLVLCSGAFAGYYYYNHGTMEKIMDDLERSIRAEYSARKELDRLRSLLETSKGIIDDLLERNRDLEKRIRRSEETIARLELGVETSAKRLDAVAIVLRKCIDGTGTSGKLINELIDTLKAVHEEKSP
jgi:chromosome segregation ATPase